MTASELFESIGEPFAAGLFEDETKCPTYRYAAAYRRFFEEAELTPYDGGRLYPCGADIRRNRENSGIAAVPDYSMAVYFDREGLMKKSPEAYRLLSDEYAKAPDPEGDHFVGGAGYTHCFLNYSRVLGEGLCGVEERVRALPEDDFREGLLMLLDGIRTYNRRCIALLEQSNAPQELIEALRYTPEHSPRNIYEALVAWNFIFYIDGCDDLGALDRNLLPWFRGEDITGLIRELFAHVDANDGWSSPLGPDYNEITLQCIRAIRNGRRPNLQLLVKKDMPDEVWQEVFASLATGCGQPALYNYDLYVSTLRSLRPEITDEDIGKLAFGGCTETMLEGVSSVGSDDAGINTALIFSGYMREKLGVCPDFDSFFDGLSEEISRVVKETLEQVNEYRRQRAVHRSQPVHTLFVDDCIAKHRDFNNGGSRYHWGVVNVAGLINVIDSLSAVRTLVYEKKLYSAEEFIRLLDGRDEQFLKHCRECPAYGRDDDRADLIGAELAKRIYSSFAPVPCYPQGNYYPVSNQFTTYADAGRCVKATPDGRADGDPLCDSLGAIHGNDTKGPTAMLNSVGKLPLSMVIGTPITNIRIRKENISIVRPLVDAFFGKGGMQLQVSCLSREDMLDAIAHPENHRNLVVRIGGFSEYFIRLSPELQQTVLARTEY